MMHGSGPTKWTSRAIFAAVALVVIQVSLGVLFKAVQTQGGYSFSTSGCITISEFFKFILATTFFFRNFWKNKATRGGYVEVAEDERVPFTDSAAQRSSFEESKELELDSLPSKTKSGGELADVELQDEEAPRWSRRDFTALTMLKAFLDEISLPTIIGYGHLALLYALINNTVFVLFILADPGTINLVKSGITLATALTSLVFLGSQISRIQWMAIGLQISGLVVSQYHAGSGSTYPLPTYTILIAQTFVCAVAGVFNQHLLKSEQGSLHAQNMVLYAFGVVINGFIHVVMFFTKPGEPGFFQGYGHIGAILVIVSSVLNGLAISAIYKYADAVVKCFATAISTAILLYLALMLFHADFTILMLPGTVIIFVATWLYMEAPPQEKASNSARPALSPEPETKSLLKRIFTALTPWGVFAGYGLVASTIAAMCAVIALNTWDLKPLQRDVQPTPKITSPFANTMAFMRMNAALPQRLPLLEMYEPFFHTMHYSLKPDVVPTWQNGTFLNLTHSGWYDHMSVYAPVAQVMRLILDDPKMDAVEGLLNFQFDVWVDPMEFKHMDFSRAWVVHDADSRINCYDEKRRADLEKWSWAHNYNLYEEGIKSLRKLKDTTNFTIKEEVCAGWADIYYVPRRFFEDFIVLSDAFFPQFHETALPTMMNVLDKTYRTEAHAPQVVHLSGCWGNSVTYNPSADAINYYRCGHRIALDNADQVKVNFGRLERETALIRGLPAPGADNFTAPTVRRRDVEVLAAFS